MNHIRSEPKPFVFRLPSAEAGGEAKQTYFYISIFSMLRAEVDRGAVQRSISYFRADMRVETETTGQAA